MLTITKEIYKKGFSFSIFGTDNFSTQVQEALNVLLDKRTSGKLISVLEAINTNPMLYAHAEKFRSLEGQKGVFEIKINQIRIACVWKPKPKNLVAFYAFQKKQDKWPKKDLVAMERQLELFESHISNLRKGQNERIGNF